MSGRTWQPGDVAMRTTAPHLSFRDECLTVAVFCGDGNHGPGLHWHHSHGGWDPIDVEGPAYRPLVVIDPEDREQIERLGKALGLPAQNSLAQVLREFANPAPPKPDEPIGLGAVVEDADGHRWTRANKAGEWFCECGDDVNETWDRMPAVRVLSEGVTA